MDTEDNNLLFDEDQISKRLDLLIAKYLQVATNSYKNRDTLNPAMDVATMSIAALKASVAEVIARSNRVLWRNVEQLFQSKSD